jgi:hypothetical protein
MGWHMNHRGGFKNGRGRGASLLSYAAVRRRDLAASTDRLSEDRLAGVLKLLQSASPEAETMSLFRGNSPQTSVAGASDHPDALASAHGGSVPAVPAPVVPAPVVPAPVVPAPVVPAPVVMAPVVMAPVVMAPVVPAPVLLAPVVLAPVVAAPVVLAPVVPAPAVLRRGRHRSQAPWKLAILKVPAALRTAGVRAGRFAVTMALVALAAVTIVLVVLKTWVLGVFRVRSSANRHSVAASGDLAGSSSFLPNASTPSQTRQ